ncbi:similar to MFS multidrug transporter [Botrytis cinerea T4]|uniref:Similar to MFS multidrug transporter n=1 Tax=Botryotinia fuckeliana (strain T4) TaxID=999810 RepID=G2XT54_BOTF4|nr:similar to MFS multidrug transporter [Botrytis cinerea T4]
MIILASTNSNLGTTPRDSEKLNNTPEQEALASREITGFRWALVISAISSSIFLYALDNTVVADLQHFIITRFGEVQKLPWLSVSFLLGATATNLVWVKIYTQFNAKWFYVFSVFVFELGSAICAAAPSMNAVIVGRTLCGIGGAGLYVGCMTLIAFTTTISERPLYISATGLTWGVGIVLGLVIGGAFSQSSVGWRWAFYINFLIGGVFAPVKDARSGVPFKERAVEMDYVGIILQAGAFTMFAMAINWGGNIYPWKSGQVIGLFVGSGVCFILLSIQQSPVLLTTSARRIIPVEFVSSRTIMILFAVTAASGSSAFVPIYFIPIFFQYPRDDGPLDASIRLLPFIVVMVVMVFANGALMAKWGYYMPWYLFDGLLAIAGSACIYTVDLDISLSRIYGYTVIIGARVGMWLQASFSVAQAVVEPTLIGAAVGSMTLAQFAGITITLAIANSIQAAMQGSGTDFMKTLSPDQKTAVLEAIVEAIGKTHILVIAAGSLVAVLSLFMKRETLFVSAAVAAG